MLTIRLTRKGKKNQPFFRIVVIDKRRSSKGGRAVEDLGYKNPLTKKILLKKERILYWLKNGAKPSATVHNLLVSEKIIEGKKINKFKTKPGSETAVSTTGEPKKPVVAPTQPAPASAPPGGAEADQTGEPKPTQPAPEEEPAESVPLEPLAEQPKPEEPKAEVPQTPETPAQ